MHYRFEEESYEHTYIFEDYYCTNPFCDCDHATVSLRDMDNAKNRITFLVNFNRTHTLPQSQPHLSATQLDIIKGFVKNMPDELFVLIKQRYTEAKAYGEKNPMSYLVLEPGRYVNRLEIFPRSKEPLEFSLNKTRYFAEDSYEMDPRNDNKDIQLAFYKLDLNDDKQKPIFTYKYYFNEKAREAEDSNLSQEHGALILTLNEGIPNLANMLKDRYKQAKKIGEDLMKQGPITAVGEIHINRNAVCPCGSGKKFKRCCGAKMN